MRETQTEREREREKKRGNYIVIDYVDYGGVFDNLDILFRLSYGIQTCTHVHLDTCWKCKLDFHLIILWLDTAGLVLAQG